VEVCGRDAAVEPNGSSPPPPAVVPQNGGSAGAGWVTAERHVRSSGVFFQNVYVEQMTIVPIGKKTIILPYYL
jgi:hypothetical protein